MIERTPHPGSSDFVRQHTRRPWQTEPQPEEVLRRVVTAEEALRLLFREGLRLSQRNRTPSSASNAEPPLPAW